jgi:hypothetical protein
VVLAGVDPALGTGGAILALTRKEGGVRSSASYGVQAEVGKTSIKASFGTLGEIDVHVMPSGGTATERSRCGGKPVTFESGRWQGTVRFRGEGGYTTIDATDAKAVAVPYLDLLCASGGDEGIGGHSPGALLEVRRRHGAESLDLSVRKNKRVGPTRVIAAISERQGPIGIDRDISIVDTSDAFDFEIPPGRATVAPAGPFSGSLTATRDRPRGPLTLAGNLRMDFPGRPAVPILGPGSVQSSLVRAVLNPSHPF